MEELVVVVFNILDEALDVDAPAIILLIVLNIDVGRGGGIIFLSLRVSSSTSAWILSLSNFCKKAPLLVLAVCDTFRAFFTFSGLTTISVLTTVFCLTNNYR